jgi:hypothetical protein
VLERLRRRTSDWKRNICCVCDTEAIKKVKMYVREFCNKMPSLRAHVGNIILEDFDDDNGAPAFEEMDNDLDPRTILNNPF